MKNFKKLFQGLHSLILLWATQSFSELGSSMTSYALVIRAYIRSADGVFLCTLRTAEYLCRRFERQMG